jgi:hypothetical protein
MCIGFFEKVVLALHTSPVELEAFRQAKVDTTLAIELKLFGQSVW